MTTHEGIERDRPIIIGDWNEGDEIPVAYLSVAVESWSGGVVWYASREQADDVVSRFTPDDDMSLAWDGDVLVYTVTNGEDADHVERVEPDPELGGEYRIGFGWTWVETTLADLEDEGATVALLV